MIPRSAWIVATLLFAAAAGLAGYALAEVVERLYLPAALLAAGGVFALVAYPLGAAIRSVGKSVDKVWIAWVVALSDSAEKRAAEATARRALALTERTRLDREAEVAATAKRAEEERGAAVAPGPEASASPAPTALSPDMAAVLYHVEQTHNHAHGGCGLMAAGIAASAFIPSLGVGAVVAGLVGRSARESGESSSTLAGLVGFAAPAFVAFVGAAGLNMVWRAWWAIHRMRSDYRRGNRP